MLTWCFAIYNALNVIERTSSMDYFIFGLIIVAFLGITVLALVWQKRGLSGQQKALTSVDESIDISRRSIANQEKSLSNADEYLSNQKIMIDLLQQLVRQQKK